MPVQTFDFDHMWGSDLTLTAGGGINVVTATTKGEQRVLRRLMTNPGEYIWHPTYGAGIPRFVGRLLIPDEIEGVIRAQMTLEPVVSQVPQPTIIITPILNGVFVDCRWVDAVTGEQANLAFDLNGQA